MSFSIQYKPLFKVDLLHLYFLNNGLKTFFTMNVTEAAKQMDGYALNSFLSIAPTLETQQKLNGYSLVYRNLNSGFTIWTKVSNTDNAIPFIPLPDDLSLTFLVKINDPAFYNYTNLKLDNQGKINYFSNRRLATEVPAFPLINKSGDHFNINETFALTPESAASELTNLSTVEKTNLLGLIRLHMKADVPALNIIDSNGKISNPPKNFELVFANRKTLWRYIFRKDPKVKNNDDVKMEGADPNVLISKSEQPLTQKGFISVELGGKDLPNPDSKLIKPDSLNSKYYSEIYM
ncbi:hypothetical protein AQPE_1249 [Aquipluma nitroreducens]|uniref:Uncharacterized protein n=1 Tax=Aquipluma nitroreducens TaxID=2010828 RepID=A0A5K7S6I4_9BACT|nr:hypothetical protein [Aquipluma nitroreducens]BBE17100.1 hypothetical protein AQPE_1249 [Aquipluma nitroreducens]